jgi:hypothetical protein
MQVQTNRKPGETAAEDDPLHYTSTVDAFKKILRQDGVLGLYRGIFGGLVGVASTNLAYFYWYTFVRDMWKKRHQVRWGR